LFLPKINFNNPFFAPQEFVLYSQGWLLIQGTLLACFLAFVENYGQQFFLELIALYLLLRELIFFSRHQNKSGIL